MRKKTGADYDLLYNPRLSVPDFAQIAQRWNAESAQARAMLDCYLDVPYGSNDTETMDVFRSQGPSRGTLMFIHGGYWRAQDKADYSFLAPALTRAGITLAIPNYALCPTVEVRDIVMQMVQACAWLYRNASHFGAPGGRLHVCGHSAGGHLTAMMLACLWPVYAADLPARTVNAGLSISGIFDLMEIVKVPSINADVRLRPADARLVSPLLLPPATDAKLYLSVGGAETGGFHMQHRAMADRWKKNLAQDIQCPGDNHFTILDKLARPDSALYKATLGMMGIASD
jgi:arylformamidase